MRKQSESQPRGKSVSGGALIALALAATITRAQATPAQAAPPEAPAQEITFPSGSLTLHGFLFKPAGDGPFPAILWNHGSELLPGRLQPLADFFTGKGYVFFIPHRRGQGRSSDAGPYVMDVLRTEGQQRGSSARSAKLVEMMEVHFQDQLAALAYLHSLVFVDAKRIVAMGCSFGGFKRSSRRRRLPIFARLSTSRAAPKAGKDPRISEPG